MKSWGGDDGKLPKTEQQADPSFVSWQHTILTLHPTWLHSVATSSAAGESYMPGKTVYYCPGRRFLPVAYKSWSKIIPLEISLQQVTRYLKMFKCQKYLVNLEKKPVPKEYILYDSI